MDRALLFITLRIFILSSAQYTDDSDYDDLMDYNDSPFKKLSINNLNELSRNDDFYIIPNDLKNLEKQTSHEHANKKVYRYTKHRIPGYDYDEIDLVDDRNMKSCDERSVRTHCLCQFTCLKPNVVDCYTPCKSGCECKEDFVYDENTEKCVYPEECTDHLI